jgi:octaprenyl-diphosphate synthase
VQKYSYFCAVKNLNYIIHPIAAELQQFEVFFEQTLHAETAPMNTIMQYVHETKGKRLRPVLVLLSAKLFGEPNERTLRAATFVEMVHSATLIHDDVVDNSDVRRDNASVKAHFGNLSAVLAGDYLLAKAMLLIANDADILNEMLTTTAAMSEGELMQNNVGLSYHGSRNNDKPQARLPQCDSPTNQYLDIITRKTALLMRSCCAIGAMSVDASEEQITKIADFGLHFGQLFQMRDDILDADNAENVKLAKEFLPIYQQETLKKLEVFPNNEILDALKDLTVYCAKRDL